MKSSHAVGEVVLLFIRSVGRRHIISWAHPLVDRGKGKEQPSELMLARRHRLASLQSRGLPARPMPP